MTAIRSEADGFDEAADGRLVTQRRLHKFFYNGSQGITTTGARRPAAPYSRSCCHA